MKGLKRFPAVLFAAVMIIGLWSAAAWAAPAAPTNLEGCGESTVAIGICWTDNSSDELGFRIERSTDGTTFTEIATVGPGAWAFEDVPLPECTTYWYRIRAYNASGDSGYSNVANAHTIGACRPAPPSELTMTGSTAGTISLAWRDNSSNENAFCIYRSGDGILFTEVGSVGANVTAYTDSGLSPATMYWYKIIGRNDWGDGNYSNVVNVTTLAGAPPAGGIPAAPTGLAATSLSSSSIRVTWFDGSTDETGFRVKRAGAAAHGSYADFATITTLAADTTSYTDTGLAAATEYWYIVEAFNAGGYAYGSAASATTLSGTSPPPEAPPGEVPPASTPVGGIPAPTSLTAQALSGKLVRLTWVDNASSETGIIIERKTGSGAYALVTKVGANTTSYEDNGVSSNTAYCYKLKAYNAEAFSTYSNESCVTTPAAGEVVVPPSSGTVAVISFYVGKTSYCNRDNWRDMDTAPTIRDGRTFLPIRYVTDALGASLDWNSKENKVTIKLSGKVIELWIGKNQATVNGEKKLIDSGNKNVMPFIQPPGRTMLPLRFISENLGCSVDWNAASHEARVTYTPATG
ncbi:MAG: stalk domain-containing protein [Bacillota bacterium]